MHLLNNIQCFRLWEAIDKYLLICREEIAEKANQWVESYKKKISKRLEVKTGLQTAKYQRAKINIYETRLAELRDHSERVESHKTVSIQYLT